MPQRRAKSRKKTKNKSTKDESTKKNKMPTRQRKKIREAKGLLTKIAYCDGVGTTKTGPIYKLIGLGIYISISSYIIALIYKWLYSGWSFAKIQVAAAEQNYDDLCKSTAETAYFSWKRQTKFVNQACKDAADAKAKWIYNLNEASREAIMTILGVALSAISPGVVDVVNKDSNFTRMKVVGTAVLRSQNAVVCALAAAIEFLTTTCGRVSKSITGKAEPELIKTLSSELRLFDNSLKF